MIKHHPTTQTLAEFASGSLGLAPSLAVKAHLHFCNQCRKTVESMQILSGALLETVQPQDIDKQLLVSVLEKIDSLPTAAEVSNAKPASLHSDFPPVVARLIDNNRGLNWRKLSRCLQIADLKTGQPDYSVSLHKIRAGGKVYEHDHSGLEYTLVLKGHFSDEDGLYQPGDFLLRQPGDIHRPYAAANSDCLCLTVVESPVKFTGLLTRWLNPFLKLRPV